MAPQAETLQLPAEGLGEDERYRLISSIVVPRPVAWIATLSPSGAVNLAPFSFFNVVSADPPVLMVSISGRDGGGSKDTLANLLRTSECVVHAVEEPLVAAAVLSAAPFPPEVSEAEVLRAELGVELEPGVSVAVPHIGGVGAAMECCLRDRLSIGDNAILLLDVTLFLVRADVLGRGSSVSGRLRNVGRMASPAFCRTTDSFELPVPDLPAELPSRLLSERRRREGP